MLIVFSLMIAAQPSLLVAGERIVDEDCGFTLTLPKGLVANPDLINAELNIVHGFTLLDTTLDDFNIVQRADSVEASGHSNQNFRAGRSRVGATKIA